MGLFDKLKGTKPEVRLTPKAALALAALTMIGVDGNVDDEELSSLRRIVRGDNNAFQLAFDTYKDLDVMQSVKLITTVLDDKQKLAVIANLLDLAMADGVLVGAEQTLLNEYVNAFQLPEERLTNLIDVIALKNDFAIFDQLPTGTKGFCPQCGQKLADGARFCTTCGAKGI